MAEEIKDQRIVVLMTPSELEEIDEWSFAKRIRSRGEAIRRLCQMGLAIGDRDDLLDDLTKAYLERMKVADEALGRLQDDASTDIATKLADYVESVSSYMDTAGTLLIEVAYLLSVATKASSHDEIERIVLASQEMRDSVRGHVYFDGELVAIPPRKDK